MKKLKNKVFLVIFLLLTLFTSVVFITSSVRNYVERKNSISDVLLKIPKSYGDDIGFGPREQDSRRIFLDFTIYTIVLDDDGNYQELINNTYNEIDEKYVKKIAMEIIEKHEDNLFIGNLFIDKYAYVFTPDDTLIIMDNSNLNSVLISQLLTNVLLFLICEILIFIITYFITKWIITPVKRSFEKQKVFVADASHELKTPLSVMMASCDAFFNDKNDKWVYNMKNESERMTKLVTELLDLAKTEEEQDIVMKSNNLSEIVEGSILTFESLFYENNIKLKYDIQKDIMFVCNEDLIIRLMGILIDNAVRHCEDNGKVTVNLSKGKQIILEVKNTGLPIKKEDEEKIFERFYRADESRNRDSNNYGLGLSIAKNIVLKHGGEILAHSSNGVTTFKVVWNQKF